MTRIGLIGAGAIAGAYRQAIENAPGVELTAVVDVNPEAAKALAEDAAVFADHEAMARADACDAVVVSTPPVTHEAITLDLLHHGIPVLCEKPLAISSDAARRMARAAADTGVLLSMASKFRYVSDVIRARDLVLAGSIGEPRHLENCFTGIVDMRQRWNARPEVSGGGVLIDNGTHSVDIIRYMLGPIAAVSAVPGASFQGLDVEDHVTFFARTETGAQATVETSWSLHKDRTCFLGLYGTEGAIEVGWKGSRVKNVADGTWQTFGTGYDKVAAFKGQIVEFAKAVRGEPGALVSIEDALASVDAISAAYGSIADGGRWMTVASEVEPRRAAAAS
ncbi:MAG: Gfo/Idh/MocA family oxidoreductase [Pseudomonadota bacterium]